MSDESDPLDDIFQTVEKAQDKSQDFSKAQKEMREVKSNLREKVAQLYSEELISKQQRNQLKSAIENSQYAKVREKIQEYTSQANINFEDEEKQELTEAFSQKLEEVEAKMEIIRNGLQDLNSTEFDQETLIDLLYANNSDIRKGDLREFFDAIDDISKPLSNIEKARAISAFADDLNIRPAENIIDAVEKRSN